MRDSIWSRFFRWVVFCLCFILFPLVLLNAGLQLSLQRQWEKYTEGQARRVTMRMEEILRATKERNFYYDLIDRLATHILAVSDRPILQERLAESFVKRYAGLIDLYLTGPQGDLFYPQQLPQGVTRFMVRKLHEIFVDFPANIQALVQQRKILWYFVGDDPDVADFLQMESSRRMAEIYPMGRRSMLYGKATPVGGVVGQVHKGARETWFPIRVLTEASNRKKRKLVLGLFSRDHFSGESLLNTTELSAVSQCLASIDHSAREWFVVGHLLVRVMVLDSNNKFWGMMRLDPVHEGMTWKNRALVYSILFFLLICGLSFGFLVMQWRVWFSIRWKLIGLFGIATGLPLVVLFVTGYDYLQRTEQNLKADAFSSLHESVKSLDQKFPQIIRDYKGVFARLQRNVKDPESEHELNVFLQQLGKKQEEMGFNTPKIAKKDGSLIGGDKKDKKQDDHFLLSLGIELMGRFNKAMGFKQELAAPPKQSVEALMLGDKHLSGMVAGLFKNLGEITRVSFGRAAERFLYMNVFQDAKGMAQSLFYLTIPSKYLFRTYLQKYMLLRQREIPYSRLFAFHQDEDAFHVPEGIGQEVWLKNFVERIQSRRSAVNDEIVLNGQTYLAVGIPGSQVDQYSLIHILPLAEVIALKQQLTTNLLLFGMLSLALSMAVGFMLSGQFLTPIGALAEGVQAINEGRFQHRVESLSDDELGQLSNSFNSTMERLEELSVAHTVQESLFPASKLELGSMEIFGQSVAATELGGDYYDYFAIDEKRLVILIGDVAGHGTASALLMAMAKATIVVEARNNPHPAHIMGVVNQMIFTAMRKKRMMTFFYALVDTENGEIEYVNAGHNSPFLLMAKEGTFIELKSEGYPLGTRKASAYKEQKVHLRSGDSLWCYTDGFPECPGSGQDILGYDLFKQSLARSRGVDALERCRAVYRSADVFRGATAQNDDMTLILLQHRGAGV